MISRFGGLSSFVFFGLSKLFYSVTFIFFSANGFLTFINAYYLLEIVSQFELVENESL
jgi:hypothetical protein